MSVDRPYVADPLRPMPTLWWSPTIGVVEGDREVPADAVRLVAENERTHPDLLRWCGWPDCLRSYNAATGPVDQPGWIRVRDRSIGAGLLLCPNHAATEHLPRGEPCGHGDWAKALCDCGRSARVTPGTGATILEWWADHVRHIA